MPPYGFEVDPDGTMAESEVEQMVLGLIQDLKGEEPLTEIAKRLNQRNFLTRNGKSWTRHTKRSFTPGGTSPGL